MPQIDVPDETSTRIYHIKYEARPGEAEQGKRFVVYLQSGFPPELRSALANNLKVKLEAIDFANELDESHNYTENENGTEKLVRDSMDPDYKVKRAKALVTEYYLPSLGLGTELTPRLTGLINQQKVEFLNKDAWASAMQGRGGSPEATGGITSTGPRGQRLVQINQENHTLYAIVHELFHAIQSDGLTNLPDGDVEGMTEYFTLQASGLNFRLARISMEPVFDDNMRNLRLRLDNREVTHEQLVQRYFLGQPALPVWLKLGDLAPCERLFFAYRKTVNHSAAFELLEACRALNRTVQIPDQVSLQLASPPGSFVQLVPLEEPQQDFMFLQDQFIFGGLFGSEPGPWQPVVRLCRRKLAGSLNQWAKSQLPKIKLLDQPLALDDRLAEGLGDDQNGVEFGGNFLLSPAVMSSTDQRPAGPAGPMVPPHPAAPWGKLIIGDARHPEKPCLDPAQGQSGNSLSKVTRDALCTHTLQPVVPIDTSWLQVGHVDEIVSFAQGKNGPCLSVASPALMLKLLERLQVLWPELGSLTCFHAGKLSDVANYEQTPSELLTRKDYNFDIDQNAIAPIVDRLKATVGIRDVLQLPVWFEGLAGVPLHQNKAKAETVDVVNMIVLPGAVIVPRPYGPRLPFEVAAQIVKELVGTPPNTKPTPRSFRHWPGPKETLRMTACIFAPCPAEHYKARQDALISGKTDGWLKSDPVTQLAGKIAKVNGITIPLDEPLGLCRLEIPLDHVDVVELLIAECYAAREIHCEFADAWIYHRNVGELHCGSNSLRTLPPDWLPIDLSQAFSCPYDETTVKPPKPPGPVEFKNGQKVIVSLGGVDKEGVALMNRKPQNPANMFVRIDGQMIEVSRASVRPLDS